MKHSRVGLLGIAFLSGAAALFYQIVWLRWLGVLFGSSAHAAAATLSAFFAGLAIGAAVFGRVASRARRPLRVYAWVELAAAGAALAVPFVFALYDWSYATLYESLSSRAVIFVSVKFVLAFALMLPAAVMLGGTLPLLAAGYVRDPQALGSSGSWLYGVNTFGAAVGTATAAFFSIEALGVRGTYAVGIALSLLAAAGAAWLAREASALVPADAREASALVPADAREASALVPADAREASALVPADAREGNRLSLEEVAPVPTAWLAIACASGFGTLALEVLLIHALAQIVDHTVYSAGAILIVVLIALAGGAAIVSVTARWLPARGMLVAALLAEAALLFWLPTALEGQTALGSLGRDALFDGVRIATLYAGPVILVGALVLPLTFRLGAGGPIGARLGTLLAANTVGGIAGSIAAGFFLLGGLGLWRSIGALGAGYAALAVLALEGSRARIACGVACAGMAGVVVATGADPFRLPVAWPGGAKLLAVEESPYGVISVVEGGGVRFMKLNNHYTLSGYGSRHALKERPGHLPLLLHPDPKRVLYLGSATGHTAGAAVVHDVDEIVLVEIVPEVQALAGAYFAETNRAVHHDARTRLVAEDGRNHLRASRDHYDVVISDLFTPWRPGVGSLYTHEHFGAVRARLTANGVFCQWLPIFQLGPREYDTIVATFLDVFPEATLWRGDFYLLTSRVALCGFAGAPPSEAQVEARRERLAAAGVDDRWLTGPLAPWMLYVGPLAPEAAKLAGVARNTDDRPRFEFLAARTDEKMRIGFRRRGFPARAERIAKGAAESGPFGPAAVRGAAAGMAFAQLNRAFVRQRPAAERAEASARVAELVPPELLAKPDPSAAEIWLWQSRADLLGTNRAR